MKTLITLNIGLNTIANTRLDIHHAIGAIQACGVSITASAVVNGEWSGTPEPCLFLQGFVADPHGVAFRAQIYLASRLLSQHCLAIYCDGKGELIGENPEGWQFEPALFHFHPEKRELKNEIPLSECQAIQKETRERLAAAADTEAKRVEEWQANLAKLRATLTEILKTNDWKPGSKAARSAEYAFTLGAETILGPCQSLQVCRLSGRSILG